MSLQLKRISYEVKNEIAYVGFGLNNHKSMTTLNVETLEEFQKVVDELKSSSQNGSVKGIILFGHVEGCFIAGAEIEMIGQLKTESEGAEGAATGQRLFCQLEDLKLPSICVVDGVCLGGGLELALSCQKIIASDSAKTQFALPEVKLGLIPGFGGTYRLPKKIGLPMALDMILSGKMVKAAKAKKLGLVDEVYPKERLLEMAALKLNERAKGSSLKESLEDMASNNFISRKIIFQKARETVLKQTKGFYQAPLKILDVMESNTGKSRDSYLSAEAQAFGELCISEQSKNLQHVFFLMDSSKKFPGKSSELGPLPVKRGGVLGAGTMGGGIAWLFADNGQTPFMKDINSDALELGLKQASRNFKKALERKKMTVDQFEKKQRSITATLNLNGFKKVDLLVEAIVENMDIKRKVLAETEKFMRDDAIMTSNTSSLSISEMSKALEHPERFLGLHFFNPVNKMPLVEIITHEKVSERTIESVYKWALQVKKTPIVVGDGPGFLVNRILMPYMNEAIHLLEEGVSLDDLDQACLNFGMPMGPARLMDEVGIDVGAKVAKIISSGVGPRLTPSALYEKVVSLEHYGKKTGKGFYIYDDQGKVTGKNSEFNQFFPENKIEMDETNIQMRVILPMINEAAAILEEGLVKDAATVDLGLIFGTGFPPFRGGLLKYADSEGLERILDALKGFERSVNKDRYKAVDYLINLVNDKKKFYDI